MKRKNIALQNRDIPTEKQERPYFFGCSAGGLHAGHFTEPLLECEGEHCLAIGVL